MGQKKSLSFWLTNMQGLFVGCAACYRDVAGGPLGCPGCLEKRADTMAGVSVGIHPWGHRPEDRSEPGSSCFQPQARLNRQLQGHPGTCSPAPTRLPVSLLLGFHAARGFPFPAAITLGTGLPSDFLTFSRGPAVSAAHSRHQSHPGAGGGGRGFLSLFLRESHRDGRPAHRVTLAAVKDAKNLPQERQ